MPLKPHTWYWMDGPEWEYVEGKSIAHEYTTDCKPPADPPWVRNRVFVTDAAGAPKEPGPRGKPFSF